MFSPGSEFLAVCRFGQAGPPRFLGLETQAGNIVVSRHVVGSGLLYNHKDLVVQWSSDQETSPADLLVRGFRRHANTFVSYLRGDFAFCIWDDQLKSLFCCRDQVGVEPAYYCFVPNTLLAVASSPKLLFQVPSIPYRWNDQRIGDFLVSQLEGVDKTSSFYQGVFRLPPGHWLVLDQKGLCIQRYWSCGPAVVPQSEPEVLEAFRTCFREAVVRRSQGEGSLASMLSGGMDSTSVANVAAECVPVLRTFSVRRDLFWRCPESRAVVEAQKGYGNNACTITEADLDEMIPKLRVIRETLPEPFDHSMILNSLVYFRAQQFGCKVILDGIDGDNLLDEGSYLARLLRQGSIRSAWREAQGLAHFWGPEFGVWQQLYQAVRFDLLPPFLKRVYRMLRPIGVNAMMSPYLENSLISRDFAESVKLSSRLEQLGSWPTQNAWLPSQVEASHRLDSPYLTAGIERYGRVMSAFGLRGRHPLTDVDLIEFCIGLSPEFKLRHGWPKAILRQAMKGRLPEAVNWRIGKEHLGWYFSELYMTRSQEELLLFELDDGVASRLDKRKLDHLQRGLRGGDLRNSEPEQVEQAVALSIWMGQHRQRPDIPSIRSVIEQWFEERR